MTFFNVLTDEEYLIYLRKSRADNPEESVEEVLAKHEQMLQEYAEKELGGRIPEECIFREVVSGETIEERPEMNRLLQAIENPRVKGVLVVEPQRLSRGDLEDCGKVVNAFRYSNTQAITLQMPYDLSNKMQRKFFEQELMRGNDFLEYTKEILLRGRILSVQNGNYIGNIPPFGYDKAIIDDCPSLKPNENADIVRMVFDMYVNEGRTYYEIAKKMDALGVKPNKSEKWERSSVRAILKNVHYIGKVRFGGHKTEKIFKDGQLIKKRNMPVNAEDVIIAEGKHEAIVSREIFDAAQYKLDNNPRAKWDAPLQNIFAGLLFCGKCGKAMARRPYKRALDRYECSRRCGNSSATIKDVLAEVKNQLVNEQLPALEVKVTNNDGNAIAIQKKQLEKLSAELEEMRKQEARQYELLEKGIYSEDIFVKRNKELNAEIDALKSKVYEVKKNMPKSIDYKQMIVTLKDAIAALDDENISIDAKNKLLKTIIERIDYEFLERKKQGEVVFMLDITLLI